MGKQFKCQLYFLQKKIQVIHMITSILKLYFFISLMKESDNVTKVEGVIGIGRK